MASPFVSQEIIGALGVAGTMAHHFAHCALRRARQGRQEKD